MSIIIGLVRFTVRVRLRHWVPLGLAWVGQSLGHWSSIHWVIVLGPGHLGLGPSTGSGHYHNNGSLSGLAIGSAFRPTGLG